MTNDSQSTAPLPSVALIAAGKCPGWNRAYGSGTGFYSSDADAQGDRYYLATVCGKKITRGDLCGSHDNQRARETEERDRFIARKALQQRCDAASGLLSERFGVYFGHNSREVTLSANEAEALLAQLAVSS